MYYFIMLDKKNMLDRRLGIPGSQFEKICHKWLQHCGAVNFNNNNNRVVRQFWKYLLRSEVRARALWCDRDHITMTMAMLIHGLFHNTTGGTLLPLILTVGEFGPADCFLHPLQFWHRLSASEMKEQRESSSKRSESSKENLSPSSHSANISSITLAGGEGEKAEALDFVAAQLSSADTQSAGWVHGRRRRRALPLGQLVAWGRGD